MSLTVFNFSLLIGWLMASAGACFALGWPGVGVAGVLLLALTFAVARIAGLFAPREKGSDVRE